MSYAAEREVVGLALRDWTACPILWPSSDIDPEQLAPSANATAPTQYLVVAITREREQRIAARGLRQIDGTVRIWCWCERRLGDGLVEARAQELATLLGATVATSWTWTDYGLGDPVIDVGYYGAELHQEFTRFEQSA